MGPNNNEKKNKKKAAAAAAAAQAAGQQSPPKPTLHNKPSQQPPSKPASADDGGTVEAHEAGGESSDGISNFPDGNSAVTRKPAPPGNASGVGTGKGKKPDTGRFSVFGEENSPSDAEEEGEVSPAGDGDPGGLAADVLSNLEQQRPRTVLTPGSALEKTVIKALEKAIENDTTPPAWVLQLVMGTDAAVDNDVRVTKVTPRSLASDMAAEPSTPVAGVGPPVASSPSPLLSPSISSVPQTSSVNLVTNTVNQDTVSMKPFTLKNTDLPSDLSLSGLPSEDVPEKMALYKAHIRLLSPDDVSESTINHRAIKHLALFVKGAAAKSLSLILSNSLEWRPETQLAALRNQGVHISPRTPTSWEEWVTAFTTLFAPANRISLLARDVMTLQAKAAESVDEYALRVSQAYSRFLAEAERTAPVNTTPHQHAFDQALIASFENGLQPEIRVEMIREDASQSFMASKARARKHEANKLRSAAPSSATSVSSLYHNNPQLEDLAVRLEQRVSHLETEQEHVSSVQRGRDNGRNGGGDKRPRSRSGGTGRDSNKSKASFKSGSKPDAVAKGRKKQVDEPCDFFACKSSVNRWTHTRANCRLEALAQAEGYSQG